MGKTFRRTKWDEFDEAKRRREKASTMRKKRLLKIDSKHAFENNNDSVKDELDADLPNTK